MVMTFLTELRLIRGMKVLMAFTTPTTLTLNESWRSFSRTEGSDSLERGNVRNQSVDADFHPDDENWWGRPPLRRASSEGCNSQIGKCVEAAGLRDKRSIVD